MRSLQLLHTESDLVHLHNTSESALKAFFHSLHWQREERSDNHAALVTQDMKAPVCAEGQFISTAVCLTKANSAKNTSHWQLPWTQTCSSSSSSPPLPAFRPEAESLGDGASAEVSRTDADAFPIRCEQQSSITYLCAYSHTACMPSCLLRAKPAKFLTKELCWALNVLPGRLKSIFSFVNTQTREHQHYIQVTFARFLPFSIG